MSTHHRWTESENELLRQPSLLDLFSGIGGFSLGLERAGYQTVAFCEIEDYPRKVLSRHWPGVPIYDDVRKLDATRLRADGIDRIDAICGGFPCQDISLAGSGAGLAGERSGLWREFARLVGELRPRHVYVENVSALLGRGIGDVLADLAALGYDAEWHCIPACAVGAPHRRDRVWIVAADPMRLGREGCPDGRPVREACERGATEEADPNADRIGRERVGIAQHGIKQSSPGPVAERLGQGGWRSGEIAANTERTGCAELRGLFQRIAPALAAASTPWQRTTESPFRGMDDGIPARLDFPRIKALGNAVVPQIPEILGRAVLEGNA